MTPSKTPFAGYERLEPGDPLSSDGYSFQFDNPLIADQVAKLGVVTHKHDAHAAMVDPTTAPTVTLAATGGSIPSNTPVYVCYTLLDGQGGESLPTDAVIVTTGTGYSTPGAPTVAVDYTSGTLLAGAPMYAVTVPDGVGGETALGDAVTLTVDPGHANAEADLSGLTALTDAASGSSTSAMWRVWRSVDGGSSWNLMGTNFYYTDTFTDDGSAGDCTVAPPPDGTTVGTSQVTVTIPSSGQPAAATFFSIYADTTGQFLTPCLLATLPVADYDVAQAYSSLAVLNGQPPAVSRCYPGAAQINPATDILNWTWKQPVANAAALPGSGNTNGDARVTLDTHSLYIWTGTAWNAISSGGAVSSVFTRTGAVTATTGDYTAAQVTNAADKSSSSQQSFTGELAAPDLKPTGLTGATSASRYVGATASAAPTTGTFVVGDFVIGRNGSVWVCTTAGSPGTWTNVGSTSRRFIVQLADRRRHPRQRRLSRGRIRWSDGCDERGTVRWRHDLRRADIRHVPEGRLHHRPDRDRLGLHDRGIPRHVGERRLVVRGRVVQRSHRDRHPGQQRSSRRRIRRPHGRHRGDKVRRWHHLGGTIVGDIRDRGFHHRPVRKGLDLHDRRLARYMGDSQRWRRCFS